MCMSVYLQACTPSLQMCVYRVSCMCVYICIHVRQIHMWVSYVYIYTHLRINTYIHICFCTFVYGCIYICLYVCERTLWVYTDVVCVFTNICIHIWVCTCVCVDTYTYMYEKTLCVYTKCVYTNTYTSVLVSCLQMSFIRVCRFLYMYVHVKDTMGGFRYTVCV